MNFSNTTLHYYDYEVPKYINQLLITFKTIFFGTMIMGTLLNCWQLLAVVTSPELRSRMRNKLIISTCVLHLVQCLIESPLDIAAMNTVSENCSIFYAVINITLMLDFVSNYTLLTMVIVFTLQLMDLKISVWLSNTGQIIVTVGVLLFPWIASLATVPAMFLSSDKYTIFTECLIPKSYLVFRVADTIVPLALAFIITVVVVLKKRSRFRASFTSSGMHVELLSPGPEMDEAKAYVAAVAVAFFCDLGVAVMEFNLDFPSLETRFILGFLVVTIETIRPSVMVLPWLLFSDIRQRMKTWRPWYRPGPGIDLTEAQQGGSQT